LPVVELKLRYRCYSAESKLSVPVPIALEGWPCGGDEFLLLGEFGYLDGVVPATAVLKALAESTWSDGVAFAAKARCAAKPLTAVWKLDTRL